MSLTQIILYFVLPGLLLLGVPIYASLGLTGIFLSLALDAPLQFSTLNILNGLDNFPLLAIPAFILAGNIMEKGGITGHIISIFRRSVGNIPGSLGIVTIFSCMFFAAISGSGPGTVAAIGAILIPAMIKDGYPRPYAAAVSATGGTLGVMIPPSNPLIIYGIIANVSIADLFAAGMIPGFMTAIILSIVAYLMGRRVGAVVTNSSEEPKESLARLLWDAKYALFLPLLILGGIYSGIFTPVEASVVAVVYALLVSILIYKQLTWPALVEATDRAIQLSAALMIIVACSTLFATMLTLDRIPVQMTEYLTSLDINKYQALFFICIVLLVIGTFMETISAIIILTPLLVPFIVSFGIDPVHFGIILIVTIEIAFLTPPLGVNLFVASQLADIPFEKVMMSILPFIAALLFSLVLIVIFPQLSLTIPAWLG